ncbi:hypothetical protein FEM48_Zijuj08G0161600 [Ziziphus jujuba var. spinosa]|uniref:Uncharacterized protein n=1 Tax=Ziziphus jujuba var. spinosa TaxID=714518 RepID=A0A978V028_ZIZJJ|nr:hypothetical protein FEM48_Zijuj08G0161600 [Ziziphus jujuba var. spinosa]
MKEATISNNLSSMASKPFDSDEGKPFIQGIMDESCGIPVGYSGFKLLKPSFDEVDRQCSIDILPLIFEEASCPKYPLDSSNAQDIYNISVLPQEGNNLQGASQLAFLSILEVPNPPKDQKSMDTYLNCQNCIDLQMNNADTYSSCIVDIKVEKESLQAPESNDEAVESLKNESVLINLQKVLQRQSSLKLGLKLMQLLINHFTSRGLQAFLYNLLNLPSYIPVKFWDIDTDISNIESEAECRKLCSCLMVSTLLPYGFMILASPLLFLKLSLENYC